MYPNTPEMTQEQREKLIELLKSIGSGGKGCRSGQNDEIHRVFGVPARYFADRRQSSKGTNPHVVGGNGSEEDSNK